MTKLTNLNERALLAKPGRHRVADNLFMKVLDRDSRLLGGAAIQ